jgi:hypothetical protein
VRDAEGAVHWKNLGLVLGFQARYREALHCYERCRQICARTRSEVFLGKFHGNAWLRAAVIHGKLLVEDGDLAAAWRLFLEYRAMFGDDYNFSLWFGHFAADLGAYALGWTFLSNARRLQPHCPEAYQILVSIASRVPGDPADVRARIEEAKAAQAEAFQKYSRDAESPAMERACGGLRDWADGLPDAAALPRLDPDPLAGASPDVLPEWVARVAAERRPFRPWSPDEEDASGAPALPGAGEGGSGGGGSGARGLPVGLIAAGGLAVLLALLGVVLVVRGRARAA